MPNDQKAGIEIKVLPYKFRHTYVTNQLDAWAEQGHQGPQLYYSTFSRRAATLTVWIGRLAKSQPRHVVIDSTGLKVYGEGEWKVRQHGTSATTQIYINIGQERMDKAVKRLGFC